MEMENKNYKYWIEVYFKKKKIDNYEFNANYENGDNILNMIELFYENIYDDESFNIEIIKKEIE